MPDLSGQVAVVTGASRGVGRGAALGLAEAGASVYATGRTAAEEATGLSGQVIPVRCDHTDDREVESVFRRVLDEQGRLDVLVNSVWGGYEGMIEDGKFTCSSPRRWPGSTASRT